MTAREQRLHSTAMRKRRASEARAMMELLNKKLDALDEALDEASGALRSSEPNGLDHGDKGHGDQ